MRGSFTTQEAEHSRTHVHTDTSAQAISFTTLISCFQHLSIFLSTSVTASPPPLYLSERDL